MFPRKLCHAADSALVADSVVAVVANSLYDLRLLAVIQSTARSFTCCRLPSLSVTVMSIAMET